MASTPVMSEDGPERRLGVRILPNSHQSHQFSGFGQAAEEDVIQKAWRRESTWKREVPVAQCRGFSSSEFESAISLRKPGISQLVHLYVAAIHRRSRYKLENFSGAK